MQICRTLLLSPVPHLLSQVLTHSYINVNPYYGHRSNFYPRGSVGSGGEKRLSRIQWVGRVFKNRVSVRRNHKPSHRNVQSLRVGTELWQCSRFWLWSSEKYFWIGKGQGSGSTHATQPVWKWAYLPRRLTLFYLSQKHKNCPCFLHFFLPHIIPIFYGRVLSSSPSKYCLCSNLVSTLHSLLTGLLLSDWTPSSSPFTELPM